MQMMDVMMLEEASKHKIEAKCSEISALEVSLDSETSLKHFKKHLIAKVETLNGMYREEEQDVTPLMWSPIMWMYIYRICMHIYVPTVIFCNDAAVGR